MDQEGTKTQTHSYEPIPARANMAAKITIQAAFSVHTQLGPGLLESVYEKCLAHAIRRRGLLVERQILLPIDFEGLRINSGLRLDMLVDQSLIVEVKAVEVLLPVHKAQLLTYLKLSGYRLGLLLNFDVEILSNGITHMVN